MYNVEDTKQSKYVYMYVYKKQKCEGKPQNTNPWSGQDLTHAHNQSPWQWQPWTAVSASSAWHSRRATYIHTYIHTVVELVLIERERIPEEAFER